MTPSLLIVLFNEVVPALLLPGPDLEMAYQLGQRGSILSYFQHILEAKEPSNTQKEESNMTTMQMKLELVAVPVSDVDRAKAFYTEKIGFNADHDYQVRDDLRFVQLTPPGSACSIVIGVGITDMPPGSQKGLQMVVADVKAVRDELFKRGVAVSEIEVQPWGTFVYFSDPDGNRWSLQQIPSRT